MSARMLPMATALASRGHAVHLLIPPYDQLGDSGNRWMQDGVQVENMVIRFLNQPHRLSRHLMTLEQVSLAWQLQQRAHHLNPDIVHIFKPVGTAALAMRILHMRKTPRIVVDNDDWEGAGGWLDANRYPRYYKIALAQQESWSLRHARAVTCASYTLAERTSLFADASTPKLVLPNGPAESLRLHVAHAETQRAQIRQRLGWADSPVVIYSGTIPLLHDMDMAVTAVRTALKRFPQLKWVVIAAGDGVYDLREQVNRAGIAHAVEWHTFMPHDQLVEYLVGADIAIYPYRDTPINRAKCSGKVIDYMACAKPMVISDVGMNRAYVKNGSSGLLTAPGDATAFGAALLHLLGNPVHAEQMGHAAQLRLWQQFGWSDRILELETLYESVLTGAINH